jgi:hypothetical protein
MGIVNRNVAPRPSVLSGQIRPPRKHCVVGGFIGQTRDPAYSGNGPGAIALPPLVIYQNSVGPLSHRSQVTAGSAPAREVRGEACQSALTLPVGLVWAAIKSGNTAYAPAYLSGGVRVGTPRPCPPR